MKHHNLTRMGHRKATGQDPEANIKGEPERDDEDDKSGGRPIGPPDYVETAEGARDEIRGALEAEEDQAPESEENPSPTPPVVAEVEAYTTLHPQRDDEDREANIDIRALEYIGGLLSVNTLEAHKMASEMIETFGLQARQRFKKGVHKDPKKPRRFSEASPDKVNDFAKWLVNHLHYLTKESILLELGPGYGNDALYIAQHTPPHVHVMGVDINGDAVKGSKGNLRKNGKGLKNRVSFHKGDFFDLLNITFKRSGLGGIVSCSTSHYEPPLVLRDITFPLMANALRDKDGVPTGKLFLAMKSADSAAAIKPDQYKLLPGAPYDPSIDLTSGYFRVFVRTEEEMRALLEPSFDIGHIELVAVPDYEQKGDTEYFWHVIATPKKLVESGPSASTSAGAGKLKDAA